MGDILTVGVVSKKNGYGGGPYESSLRIINSKLSDQFSFETIEYDQSIGKKISLARIINLKRQINSTEINILHFSGLQLEGFHIAIAAKLAGIPSIMTIRGFSGDDESISRKKRVILTYIIEPLTLLLVNSFYSNSIYTSKREVLKFFNYKSAGVIYNFPLRRSLKRINIKDTESKVVKILIVSRVTIDKGFLVLEKIIKQMSGYNIEFHILGDGYYLEEFKNNIRTFSNVFCHGNRRDLDYYYSSSDILLHPSLHETLGNVLIEASQYGLPLVATDTGGIKEIIDDGENGFRVERENANQFKQKLLLLIKDVSLRKKMGEKAKLKVKIFFDEDKIASKIRDVYNKIANE